LYEYVRNKPLAKYDPAGMSASPEHPNPSSPGFEDRVCCQFRKKFTGGAIQGTDRWQETRELSPGMDEQCVCKRGTGSFQPSASGGGAGLGGGGWGGGVTSKWTITLENVLLGPCCSCKVQVRRKNEPWSGWPSHVAFFVWCSNDDKWFADFPNAGADAIPADGQGDYPEVVCEWCVSCKTGEMLKKRADSYSDYEYQSYGWRDCYWFKRKMEKGSNEWRASDGCDGLGYDD